MTETATAAAEVPWAPSAGEPAVSARWRWLAGATGSAGAAALGVSFGLLPAPPTLTAPLAKLTSYAASHHHAMLAAAWLEGTGTLLYGQTPARAVRWAGIDPAVGQQAPGGAGGR